MTIKLSASQILSCVIGLFILLLLGVLSYSLNLTSRQYQHYKLQAIMNSPYESYATITGKYPMGGGFEIQYQFKGVMYEEVMKTRRKLYKQYRKGDKIPITISSKDPSLVSITNEFNDYKTREP